MSKIISSFFIQSLFKINLWFSNFVINREVKLFRCLFIVMKEYMTCVIATFILLSYLQIDLTFTNSCNAIFNFTQTSCANSVSMKACLKLSVFIILFLHQVYVIEAIMTLLEIYIERNSTNAPILRVEITAFFVSVTVFLVCTPDDVSIWPAGPLYQRFEIDPRIEMQKTMGPYQNPLNSDPV